MKYIHSAGLALLLLAGSQILLADPASSEPQRNAYFGDLHLHTSYSFDAYVFYEGRVTPEQAYRFAKGEPIPYLGKMVKRAEPLDFLAVTDHSENIGVYRDLDDPNSDFSKSELGQRIHREGANILWQVVGMQLKGEELPGFDAHKVAVTAWQHEIDAANSQYEPGKFTTLIGYEWTSMAEDKYNLHRNVLFAGKTAPFPFTADQSRRPEDLWTWLETERRAGYDVLAISHNANASGGLMFNEKDSDGRPIDEAYALRRVLNEPLTEIAQGKGASETHPVLSPNDEFAGFEIYDTLLSGNGAHSEEHGSYVREALGKGLEIAARTGANPFVLGFVGGSDFHNGLSTSTESGYGGGTSGVDPAQNPPTREQLLKSFSGDSVGGAKFDLVHSGSGNLTAVWAEQNTRESIFAALHRKETFATSGPRIKVRFFGGWDYDGATVKRVGWDHRAYSHGVAMGGDLPAKPGAVKAPRFLVWAIKDPNGANLDRAQIVKVWLGPDRHYAEKVFEVAASGSRLNGTTGKVEPIANTVDIRTASYTNTTGATEFATVWVDPEFDASVPAVYYLRVIEIPTPRWSTIQAVRLGVPLPPEVQPSLQERAWSSPIWYTPHVGATKRKK